ncbi:hypothetical protein Hypma_014805 [Hypsizygus marmoreus]|uniref:Protein kinase domain-containing protein n=1 Tax=Hypsizygus marmoreus TaxID=39966 RepID=A0A369K7X6_HYPMA|nr:hypothetical protein Hypma_014805 [Hypsizygus marmoreus]
MLSPSNPVHSATMLFTSAQHLIKWIHIAISALFVRLFYHPPQDWAKRKAEDGVVVWDALTSLLAYHGFIHCGRPEYKYLPPPPTTPPQNPYRPGADEDLITRVTGRPPFMNTVVVRGTHIIGADRLGREVHIRAVRPDSQELRVLRCLTSRHLESDHNHTVPVICIFDVHEWTVVVQPYWGFWWDEPPLPSRARHLQVARELLEGLSFMHSQGISHGDIHSGNILISHEDRRARPRRDAEFRVAFIDFESSAIFPLDAVDHIVKGDDLPTVPPAHIRAPEQEHDKESWDAFKTDVYNLGRCLQLSWLTKELEEIQPLIDLLSAMTKSEPDKRPTSTEAHDLIEEMLKELPDDDVRPLEKEQAEVSRSGG